jgi:hypothetical protein
MIRSSKLVCLTGHSSEPSHLRLEPGQTCLHAPTAGFFRQDRSGCAHLTLPHVRSVHVALHTSVAEYIIEHVGDTTTHWVKFAAGGECLATFDHSGDLTELAGQGLSITSSADRLIIGPLRRQSQSMDR